MTEMIEKVARAIAAANKDEGGEGYEVLARAAIEAMREPTGYMDDVGDEVHESMGNRSYVATPIYTAMIDAALKETAT